MRGKSISGSICPVGNMDGQLTVGSIKKLASPEYEGPYVFDPSDQKQIIPIKGFVGTDDIIINAVESHDGPVFVQGEFTTGSSIGVAESVNIPYTGDGYPIYAIIVADIDESIYTNGVYGVVVTWTMAKHRPDLEPDYNSGDAQNLAIVTLAYAMGGKRPDVFGGTGMLNVEGLNKSTASYSYFTCARFNSAKKLSYYVNNTTYGFAANTKYRYIIAYSS